MDGGVPVDVVKNQQEYGLRKNGQHLTHKVFYIDRMEPSFIVYTLIILIVLYLALTISYRWFVGSSDEQDLIVYPGTFRDGLTSNDKISTTYSGSQMPQIYGGGEYSISTWIYVTDWNVNKGKNKPFLVLSGGNKTPSGILTLIMYLGQFTNKLGVRVSCETQYDKGLRLKDDYDNIVSGKSPYSDSSADFKKCDIEHVNLQKWVNITAVLNGRTLDIYIDGKLSRSCLLDGLFKVDGDIPTLRLGGPDAFGGLIGITRSANFAYSPDKVYYYYQNGPFSRFTLSSLDPGQYSIDIKNRGATIFSSST